MFLLLADIIYNGEMQRRISHRLLKKIYLVVILYFVLGSTNNSQSISNKEAAEELHILQTTLRELHPGLTIYRSLSEITAKFNSLYAVIEHSDSLKQRECLYHYSEICGMIRCGHTVVYAPDRLCDHYIPLSVESDAEKLFATGWLDSNILVQPEYREILKIDGIAVEKIRNALLKRISTDGYNEVSKRFSFHSDFPFLYNKYFDCTPTVKLELKSSSGVTIARNIAAVTYEEIMRTRQGDQKTVVTKRIEHGSCYLKLPTFYTKALKANHIKYKSYIKDFFREANNKNCKEIIIDIRGNRGGSVHMAGYLASFIIDSAFTFFDSVELKNTRKITYNRYIQKDSFYRFRKMITRGNEEMRYYNMHRELRTRKPHRLSPQKDVTIAVLIDHKTFSAATMFAALLKAKSDATFIGEETGGTCIGSGLSPIRMSLPYSKFIVEIPLAYIHLSVEGLHEDELYRGVQPDIYKSSEPGF